MKFGDRYSIKMSITAVITNDDKVLGDDSSQVIENIEVESGIGSASDAEGYRFGSCCSRQKLNEIKGFRTITH